MCEELRSFLKPSLGRAKVHDFWAASNPRKLLHIGNMCLSWQPCHNLNQSPRSRLIFPSCDGDETHQQLNEIPTPHPRDNQWLELTGGTVHVTMTILARVLRTHPTLSTINIMNDRWSKMVSILVVYKHAQHHLRLSTYGLNVRHETIQ